MSDLNRVTVSEGGDDDPIFRYEQTLSQIALQSDGQRSPMARDLAGRMVENADLDSSTTGESLRPISAAKQSWPS